MALRIMGKVLSTTSGFVTGINTIGPRKGHLYDSL